jgi:hypothetical protein
MSLDAFDLPLPSPSNITVLIERGGITDNSPNFVHSQNQLYSEFFNKFKKKMLNNIISSYPMNLGDFDFTILPILTAKNRDN